MKEYILLVAKCDAAFNATVRGVIDGSIKQISYKNAKPAQDESGVSNPMAPILSLPIGQDDTEYK
jgi:hypothetical protein